jgi:hypothetical protein
MKKKMAKATGISVRETQRLLGAEEPVDLGELPHDLIGMRALPGIVASRLVSRGGRPSDPKWTIARKIPMRAETWSRLRDLAREEHRLRGIAVAPGQIAAIALEQSIIVAWSTPREELGGPDDPIEMEPSARSQLTIAKCRLIAQRYGEAAVNDYAQRVAKRHQVWAFD